MIDPRAPLPEIERPRGMRQRLAALRYLPQLVRLVWQTHRGFTLTMVVLRLVRAFVPVATLWVGKLIIDERRAAHAHARRAAHRPVASGRARDRDRRRRRAARARIGARGGAARRPVLEPHQRPAHGARRDARSAAVRGPGLLRPSRARAPADDGPHRADRACCSPWGRISSRSSRSARRSSRTARGSCSCSPSRSSRASSARRTSPRWRTPCSSAGRRSGASSTTCATSARATRRRRKCRCSGSPAGSRTAIARSPQRFYEENRQLAISEGSRQRGAVARRHARLLRAPTSSILLARRARARSRSAR